MLTWQSSFSGRKTIISGGFVFFFFISSSSTSLRYAVLGAGFAGLSVAWHLLEHSTTELNVCVDILDEVGIGGGASGVSGGLLHPYSPKVKPLWRAAECWEESLRLINIAENAIHSKEVNGFIARRMGILRPGVSLKNMSVMIDNAQNSLAGCRIHSVNEDAARSLVPNICVPSDTAFYMPDAVNIHPQNYLEALYVACETLAKERSSVGIAEKKISLHKRSIDNLLELEGEYDAVVVCLGSQIHFPPGALRKVTTKDLQRHHCQLTSA